MNSYLKKGGIAIADQVLFSGSNFLLNIFLIKLLTPADYGLFGSLYSVYLLLFVAFAAAFLEPYMYYKNTLSDSETYTKLYAGFSNSLVILAILVTLLGLFFQNTVVVYIAYVIFMCIIYFYKRHFFSIMSPIKSLHISIVYFLLMIAGLVSLNYYLEKNLLTAFSILNIVSLLSIIPTILLTKEFKMLLFSRKSIIEFLSTLKRQRQFSLHCLSASVLSWVPNNIYFLLIPLFFSKELNAEFKALQNINLPLYHFNIAIVSILLPIFIKSTDPLKIIKQVSAAFIIFPLLYLVIILYMLHNIEHFIYNDKYQLQPLFVIALLIGLIFEILSNIYKSYFRSIKKPEIVTKINMLNMLMSILFIYVVYMYGLKGVVWAYVLNNAFNLLNSIYFFVIEYRSRFQKGEVVFTKNYS